MLQIGLALPVPSPMLPVLSQLASFYSVGNKVSVVVIGPIQGFLRHVKISFKLCQIESSCKNFQLECILLVLFCLSKMVYIH